jgi:oxygen-independent coproporphyrinogen III oxidase
MSAHSPSEPPRPSEPPHVDEAQILRFSGPGPRYTSYPTVPAWSEAVGEAEARQALGRAALRADEPLSLYVHLPFCARLCLFCGCTVEITHRPERVERYLQALEREIASVAAGLVPRRRAAQLHLGGGTPTHLTPAQLRRVHAMLTAHFAFEPGAEISIEVHPHVTTFEHVDTLVELGFRRFSMGVQDTDPHVQAVIHRDQSLEETAALVAHCRARGVESVNLDLLYGLPAQTERTFAQTLTDVAAIRPDRLAIYGYAHVPWLKPFQKSLEAHGLPGPAERARLFALAVERLVGEGYELIGLDHFALPEDGLARALLAGRLHRNFQGYTDQRAGEMVSFGMSAIGDVGGAFLQNARDTKEYERRIDEGRFATVKGLVRSPEDDLRRAVIQALMCEMRLDLDELGARLGRADMVEHFAAEWRRLEPLAAEGLCRLGPRSLEITGTGRLFLRHLAMVFDAHLTLTAAPRFSQTV